ncbi:NUDIX domain-containing protein [archaeon]|nr:NUDIX domain-containing protein [archaeon]
MKEHSAGAVVFIENPRKYLILQYEGGHWSFPKGKIEPGENLQETARREILEETGLHVEFMPEFKHEINYCFHRRKETVNKKVEFFLAKAKSDQVELSFEHIGCRWLEYNNAKKQLTFKNDAEILRNAERYLTP